MEDQALTIAWPAMPAFLQLFLQDCLFASVFKTASSLVLPRYRQYAATAQRWDPSTHVRVATTPELLGLCEKAGRRAPAAPPIDLECLAPTRRQRRALVRRLRRRTSRSPLVECARLRREPPLPCPTPPATTTCPSPSSKLPRSPPRSPRPSPRPRSRRLHHPRRQTTMRNRSSPRRRRAPSRNQSTQKVATTTPLTATTSPSRRSARRKPAEGPGQEGAGSEGSKSSTGLREKAQAINKSAAPRESLGAFEWWNAPDPPEGKSWTTLEHAGVTFEPQYVPHNVPLVYEGQPVKLTPRQEELATFYASMPEDGPQLSVKGGQREIFQKNFWDDFSKALGSSHTIKSFKGCDFSRASPNIWIGRRPSAGRPDAEKKATKEMKDKTITQERLCSIDGHVEKVGNFRMEPPSLFRGRGQTSKNGSGQATAERPRRDYGAIACRLVVMNR